MKKPVHSSNLMLRFYIGDGWTKELLDKYCNGGEVICNHPDDAYPYLVLDHRKRSYFDCARLYEEQVSNVIRTFNDYPSETDVQFMERYQW